MNDNSDDRKEVAEEGRKFKTSLSKEIHKKAAGYTLAAFLFSIS